MAEAISNKNADRSYIREIQQEKNMKKKELAEAQREDIKQIKTYYAEKNKEVDDDSAAAINHIKTEQTENNLLDRQTQIDERRAELEEKKLVAQEKAAERQQGASQSSVNSLYNKDGRLSSLNSEKKNLKPDHVLERGSTLSEAHNGYFIEAFAPESEKDNIRVSILNDRAVISGKRKFQDSMTDEIKTTSTNNFQTFREEFKLESPVKSQGMTRERDGDYVKYFIPKLTSDN